MTSAQYSQLAASITAAPDSSYRPLRVAVLASFTAELLRPYIIVEGARRQLNLDLWFAPFGQIEQQALDPGSDLFRQSPDLILVLPRLEDLAPDLVFRFMALTPQSMAKGRTALVSRLKTALESCRSNSRAHVVLANFVPPLWRAAGLADASLDCPQDSFVRSLNDDLANLCRAISNTHVLDMARVALETGLANWKDDRLTFLAKAPLSAVAMMALAKASARVFLACFTPPKKCLVLDMDNTLWGGVLGEQGIDGIQLGPDYPGNVFVDFQRRVLALRDRGVLLAAASKNNASDVEHVLTQHPACLLKRDHFAAFEVHWEDKATSLQRIAATLNIGTDALVFFDDNPVERSWVSSHLPQVTVLEVPTSPLGYARVLDDCGCFDVLQVTGEDLRRSELYHQEAARSMLHEQASSLEDFLSGLEMSMTIGLVNEATLPRIVQLLGKTNQFNLTTRRHTEADIEAMIASGGIAIWARLRDRFGDSGLIAAAIVLPASDQSWLLDSFLMSCRVIGRQVETALLTEIERLVRRRGGKVLLGEYLPTPKNQPCSDFFSRHGFKEESDCPNQWRMALESDRARLSFITIDTSPTE